MLRGTDRLLLASVVRSKEIGMNDDDPDEPMGLRFWIGTILWIAAMVLVSWVLVRLVV
jgi:hypothetical protein